MSDYHSHRDAHGRGAMEYETGSGASWIWALIILVALVALIAIGSTGATDDGTSETLGAPAAPVSQTIEE